MIPNVINHNTPKPNMYSYSIPGCTLRVVCYTSSTLLPPHHSLLAERQTWLTCSGWTFSRHFTPNATTCDELLCNMKYNRRVTLYLVQSFTAHCSPRLAMYTEHYLSALSRANSLRFCGGESGQMFGKRLALRSSLQYGRVRLVAWLTVLCRCSLSPRHCLR